MWKQLIKSAVAKGLEKYLAKVSELTPELRQFITDAVLEYLDEKLGA